MDTGKAGMSITSIKNSNKIKVNLKHIIKDVKRLLVVNDYTVEYIE